MAELERRHRSALGAASCSGAARPLQRRAAHRRGAVPCDCAARRAAARSSSCRASARPTARRRRSGAISGFSAIRRMAGIAGATSGRRRGPAGGRRPDPLAPATATGIPVSLVGWSRGGIIAREAARLAPDAVRMVDHAGQSVRRAGGVECRRRLAATDRRGLPGADAGADARASPRRCRFPAPRSTAARTASSPGRRAGRRKDLDSENVEVRGSHIGLGFNPAALWVIADRLAQPLGAWAPFRPSLARRSLVSAERVRCLRRDPALNIFATALIGVKDRRSTPGIMKLVAAGLNPMDLKRGIDLASAAVVKDIERRAKKVQSSQEIAQVATISAATSRSAR